MDEETADYQLAIRLSAVEISAPDFERELAVKPYNKLSVSRLAAMGTGFQPVVNAIKELTGGGGKSGFYYVKVRDGASLAARKDGAGYIGSEIISGKGVAGQSHLYPLRCNPALLAAAAVVVDIDKKLESIIKMQQEMLDFLSLKEKAALKGDLDFLLDIYNNYKYNVDSEKYKTANHIKALDIRQHAAQTIDFYRGRIVGRLNNDAARSDRELKKQLESADDDFGEYQLSLYLYGFGYFLEVLLQENFDGGYLDAVAAKISEAAERYDELYKTAYAKIESRGKATLQSKLIGGLSSFNKAVGGTIAKIPVISKTQADETLIAAGEKLGEYNDNRVVAAMAKFKERKSGCVRPFIENINSINGLYNKTTTYVFNGGEIYISSENQEVKI